MRAFPDPGVLIAALAEEGLSARHRTALESAGEVVVSAAVLWQIETWRATGEVEINADLPETLRRAGCRMLAVTAEHVAVAGTLARGLGHAAGRGGALISVPPPVIGERPPVQRAPSEPCPLPLIRPLLAAQARAEGLVLLSADRDYRLYDIDWF